MGCLEILMNEHKDDYRSKLKRGGIVERLTSQKSKTKKDRS
jgi:hypothetical protein